METEEIQQRLEAVRSHIVTENGKIDKSHSLVVDFIALYKTLTGKTVGTGTCRDCIRDAFFELTKYNTQQLKRLTMTQRFPLKKKANGGVKLVNWNGDHYTPANMTDEIAFQMIASNRKLAAFFEDADGLLRAYDDQVLQQSGNSTTTSGVDSEGKTVSITEKNAAQADKEKAESEARKAEEARLAAAKAAADKLDEAKRKADEVTKAAAEAKKAEPNSAGKRGAGRPPKNK